MRREYRLFSIFGIDINMHISFLILLGYFFVVLGLRGIVLVVAIFGCVIIHELSHSLLARRYGISVNRISLLPIGGLAHMSRISRKPKEEFLIALAGPVSNFILAFIIFLIFKLIYSSTTISPFASHGTGVFWIALGLKYLIYINLVLGIFNLIPAFPMDGGRIFRAFLSFFLSFEKATHIASWVGRFFALLFVVYGLSKRQYMLALIGLFIYVSAASEYRSIKAEKNRNQKVEQ